MRVREFAQLTDCEAKCGQQRPPYTTRYTEDTTTVSRGLGDTRHYPSERQAFTSQMTPPMHSSASDDSEIAVTLHQSHLLPTSQRVLFAPTHTSSTTFYCIFSLSVLFVIPLHAVF